MKPPLLRLISLVLLALTLVLIACSGGPATSTTGIPGPPSSEELAAQGFLHPELPRITCEQLKQKMDNGEPLAIVDTRQQFFFNTGHLPESINIIYEPNNANPEGFQTLPKDKLIIFYCD